MPPLSLEKIKEKSICMDVLLKQGIHADLPDAYTLSGYNCSLQAVWPRLMLICLHPLSQIKYGTFNSTLVGLKSKFVTNSITVKAYAVFHKLKPTTFCPNLYSVNEIAYV